MATRVAGPLHDCEQLDTMRFVRSRNSAGYTLIELLVVLVIIALASAIAIPALLRARIGDQPLQALVESARGAAAARGEIIYLRIEPTGAWLMQGGGSPLEGDSAHGHIAPVAPTPLTLLVAPSGSCTFDVRSAAAAGRFVLDPLMCEVRLDARR